MKYPVSKSQGLTGEMVEKYFFYYCVASLDAHEQLVIEMLNAGISSVLSQATGSGDDGIITYVEYMGYMAIAANPVYRRVYIRDRCHTCGKTVATCGHNLNPRLVWDQTVSADCPVFKGTWIRTRTVIEMMREGTSDEGIMAMFPELEIDDLNVVR